MKKFRFRLDRVLSLRERAEQERAQEMARARAAEQAGRDRLARARETLDRAGDAATPPAGSAMSAGAMQNARLSVDAARGALDSCHDAHRQAIEHMVREELRFGEARRDRRVLERLKERRLADWREDMEGAEQGAIDEIAQQRHARDTNPKEAE
jgi:flagellar FliJ protein